MKAGSQTQFFLCRARVISNVLVFARSADRRVFVVVKESHCSLGASTSNQRGSVRFGNRGVLVRAIPRPVSLVGRYPLEIPLSTVKAAIFDEKPNLAFQNIVDLFGFVSVGLGVVSGRSYRNHQAALIAVSFFDDHRPLSGLSFLNSLSSWNFLILYMK